jgi:hypothetical protein
MPSHTLGASVGSHSPSQRIAWRGAGRGCTRGCLGGPCQWRASRPTEFPNVGLYLVESPSTPNGTDHTEHRPALLYKLHNVRMWEVSCDERTSLSAFSTREVTFERELARHRTSSLLSVATNTILRSSVCSHWDYVYHACRKRQSVTGMQVSVLNTHTPTVRAEAIMRQHQCSVIL